MPNPPSLSWYESSCLRKVSHGKQVYRVLERGVTIGVSGSPEVWRYSFISRGW